MAGNLHHLRDKGGDTEKITINLGYVDLGRIDLLVQDGFYSNRTDFIRTAIRTQLTAHADTVRQSLDRHTLELGLRDYDREELEAMRDAGRKLHIKVVGLARIAHDVTRPPPPIPDGARFLTRSYACPSGERSYKLYLPTRLEERRRGVVIMLHGCLQNPDDFATGTRMNTVAEAYGLLVAYPAQTGAHNPSSCWNWFRPRDQERGAGEPAIISGITRTIASEFDLERDRIFVAGLSAGGAMAAVMGATYPDLYAAVGIHSGLPYAYANDVISAFAAMRGQSSPEFRETPRAAATSPSRPRTIVFHGSADETVHHSNAVRIVADAHESDTIDNCRTERGISGGGRAYECSVVTAPDGAISIEYWPIEGACHAWSGGHPEGSHTDPRGPDASREMVRFFLDGKSGGFENG